MTDPDKDFYDDTWGAMTGPNSDRQRWNDERVLDEQIRFEQAELTEQRNADYERYMFEPEAEAPGSLRAVTLFICALAGGLAWIAIGAGIVLLAQWFIRWMVYL